MEGLGVIIKDIRKRKSLSKEMLAKDICPVDVLEKIENSEESPNLSLLNKLCDRLSISVDEVFDMHLKSEKECKKWLSLMEYYFHAKQYGELYDLCEKVEELFDKFSKNDKQLVLFYKGHCEVQYHERYQLGIETYRKALDMTFYKEKKLLSDIEIILLNEVGYTYHLLENEEYATYYLDKSINAFFRHQQPNFSVDVVRIFYNQAVVYIENKNYEKTIEMVHTGISWCRKKMTMYLLEEFLYLKGIVLQEIDRLDDAIYYVEMAEKLHSIETEEQLLDFKPDEA